MRKNPAWSPVRGWLVVAAALPILALVMFMVAQAVLVPSGGHFGPGVNIGWPERIQGLGYVASTVIVAWSAIRVRRMTASTPARASSGSLTEP